LSGLSAQYGTEAQCEEALGFNAVDAELAADGASIAGPRNSSETEPFRWVNTFLCNAKTAIASADHHFEFDTYRHRHLAEAPGTAVRKVFVSVATARPIAIWARPSENRRRPSAIGCALEALSARVYPRQWCRSLLTDDLSVLRPGIALLGLNSFLHRPQDWEQKVVPLRAFLEVQRSARGAARFGHSSGNRLRDCR
jgi:hypothetical protein